MSIHTPIETDASEDRQSEREEVRRERARGRATPRNRPGIGSPAMLFPQKMIISDCIIWSECKLLSLMFSLAASLYRVARFLCTFHNHRSSALSSPLRVSTTSSAFALLLFSNGDEGSAGEGTSMSSTAQLARTSFPLAVNLHISHLWREIPARDYHIPSLSSSVQLPSLHQSKCFQLLPPDMNLNFINSSTGALRPLVDDSSNLSFFFSLFLISLHWWM